jgi:hypothetical protein
VAVVAGVGLVSPCPPQLTSGTNNISARSKATHLKAIWNLVVNRNLPQTILDLQIVDNLCHMRQNPL